MAAQSDTGVSTTDNVTSITTPTFTGSADAGATVTLFDGATVLGTGKANATGIWTIQTSTLAAGKHTITAKATDLAGNISASSPSLAVTIDTTAPAAPGTPDLATASDSGASTSDNLTRITTPRFTGKAEANATVTLLDGVTVLGTGKANATGIWTIKTSALAAGKHTITTKATDLAGNVSASSPSLAVTIDTTAPAAPSISTITMDAISGTAGANETVTLFDGITKLGTVLTNGSGAWSLSSALTAGPHVITATTEDGAGNVSVPSAKIS